MIARLSRLFLVALVFNITLYVAACTAKNETGKQAASRGKLFRVALITPGPVSDQAWNGGAYAGLQGIRDSLGAEISNIQTDNPSVIEESFRQYGSEAYDLVFGHGFEFQDAAQRVAPMYPNTVYVVTSGNGALGNAVGMEFAFEEGSYIAGVIAGSLTKSGVVGCIGGTALPPVERSFAAFQLGARSVNRNVKVLVGYVGSWNDVTAGKEHALAQIGRGADIIFGNADAAGLGVFQAARESGHVLVIGANSDQAHVAPEVVIGSVVIDLPRAFLLVAREVRDHTFMPRQITFGAQSDVVRWTYNPALEPLVSMRTRALVDSLAESQRAGKFVAPPTDTARQ